MKLVVVSHTPHYIRDGEVVGWGPTVREIAHLASVFDQVVHVAPVHDGDAPASALGYGCPNVSIATIRPAGGVTWRDKARTLRSVPSYVQTIRDAALGADVLHIRCPSNVGFVALVLAALTPRTTPPRVWVKYAGDWRPVHHDPWSFWLQRWLINRASRFVVTINGRWSAQPPHVHTLLNPCLTEAELIEGRDAAANKSLCGTLRLLFVGSLSDGKGVMTALAVLAGLTSQGIAVQLDCVGDGPLRPRLEEAASIGLPVRLHGWSPRAELGYFYALAHLIVLPSRGEGWPKVLSEAMAYGVVPVASAVGSIRQNLTNLQLGIAIDERDPRAYISAVEAYTNDPIRWRRESQRAVAAARHFTYEAYLDIVRELIISDDMPAKLPAVC